MSFDVGAAFLSQAQGFVKSLSLLKTEEVPHAFGRLRMIRMCMMVQLVIHAGTSLYANPGSTF